MRPQGTRVLRRERRRAWKGNTGGRRTTHLVKTTFGQQHRLAERSERHAAYMEAQRALRGPRYGAYIRRWEAQQSREAAT